MGFNSAFKELNATLNAIGHLLALLEPHHILHVSRIGVNGSSFGHNGHQQAISQYKKI